MSLETGSDLQKMVNCDRVYVKNELGFYLI